MITLGITPMITLVTSDYFDDLCATDNSLNKKKVFFLTIRKEISLTSQSILMKKKSQTIREKMQSLGFSWKKLPVSML